MCKYTAKNQDNLYEIDKFLETHIPPKLIQEEIENLNRPIKVEIKLSHPTKKTLDTESITSSNPIFVE